MASAPEAPPALLLFCERGPDLGPAPPAPAERPSSGAPNIVLHPGATVRVGRSRDCELRLSDPDVSTLHAALSSTAAGLVLQDLGSTNGTLLRGEPLTGPSRISPGASFRVGATELRLSRDPELVPTLPGMRLLRLLGEGALATVYEAEPLPRPGSDLPSRLALKRMHSGLGENDRRRCRREARLLASLSHEGIVRCLGFRERREELWLLTERVRGRALDERLRRRGPLSFEELAGIGREAAQALAFAHSHGVVHRDIKPANMILERGTGRLVLIDFGFARLLAGTSLDVTSDDTAIGTWPYMAPEAFVQAGKLTGAADVFSLGASLYELLTGREPFPGRTLGEQLRRRRQPLDAPPRSTPPSLLRLIQAMVQPAPEARPDAEEVARRLAAA